MPEDTTTSSLEALQAFALGTKATDIDNDYLTAVTFFQRAITLDPNFAMAYLLLAESYQPQGELALAAENTRKAYDLRERTSDHEKLSIEVFYEIVVMGNLEAARRSCELIAQTYPHDESVQIYLWYIHLICGDYVRADAAAQRAFEINPDSTNNYVSLMYCDQYLGRLDQAKARQSNRGQEAQLSLVSPHSLRCRFSPERSRWNGATGSRDRGNSRRGGSDVFHPI
jgi:tetratricopeptide (TPR) repeat protein